MTSVTQDRRNGVNASMAVKVPALVCATTNINIATGGEQTIDGVLTSSSRVLLTGQTTTSQNGLYDSNTGAWTRCIDFDGALDAVFGTLIYVASGTANLGYWYVSTTGTIVADGTMTINFTRNSSTLAVISAYWQTILATSAPNSALTALRALEPDTLNNISLVPTVGGNALTMNIKTRALAVPSASDPVMVSQRDVTLATGDFNLRTITAALSLVVPSGASLGHTNNVAGTTYWYLLDNLGVEELACSSTFFGMSGIASTTAISAAATSASVMYSTSARANFPYRCVGYTIDTQVTAGTWLVVPTTVQLVPFVPMGTVNAATITASATTLMAMINGTLVTSVGSSALTVAVKTAAGGDPSATDPVLFVFRNATAGTGDYTVITVTAALSLVVSSGSTLGTSNATAARLYICAFNDAGTVRLGIYNPLTGTAPSISLVGLIDDQLYSSTAEGGLGNADSAQVIYTGTAVTSKALRVIGYIEATEATAGTWATNASKVQLMMPGVKRTGDLVQLQVSSSSAVATGSTTIPFDDTIPQISEGNQFLSQAITPISAINLVRVKASVNVASSSSDGTLVMALFQDATANALAVTALPIFGSNVMIMGYLNYEFIAATIVSTTLRIRVGQNGAATITFNGTGGARKYGGVVSSDLTLECIFV